MMNYDQPAGSQGNSPDIHRAVCDLILDADATEIDRIIVAFRQNPQEFATEGQHVIGDALAAAETKIISLPGCPTPPGQTAREGFGRLVQMFRRREELSIVELAQRADVSAAELHQIEQCSSYLPKPRTLFQLEHFFGLSPDSLGRLSGAIVDTDIKDDASEALLRFAACADGMGKLTREEKHLLAQFVSFLARRR